MSFKLKFVLPALLAALLLVSCDSKIGEEPPPPNAQEFSGAQCLSGVGKVASAFVQGDAEEKELGEAWDCADSAVLKFKRYVRGSAATSYTPQEIATFLEDNFLAANTNVKISKRLQTEFMKIKQLFIGGSAEVLERQELDKLVELFKTLRSLTLSLNPYMKIISLNWQAPRKVSFAESVAVFEDANQEIQKSARILADLIEKNEHSYKFPDFVIFMRELSDFFGEGWSFPDTMEAYLPVLEKLKKALAGGEESYIRPSEWRRFLSLGSRGYVQYMRYYYFISQVPDTGVGLRLDYVARTVEDMLSVFQDLVAEKPEKMISRNEIMDLFQTLNSVWPGFKMSDLLLLESMRIKQLFLGGSLDRLTALDFETARLKVPKIKDLVERLFPYYGIYGLQWWPDTYSYPEAQKIFFESQTSLVAAGQGAASLFEGPYDLKSLQVLAQEVERLYPSEDGKGISNTILKYLPVVKDLKTMILGGEGSILSKSHWSLVLTYGARVYGDYLYFHYFLQKSVDETEKSNSTQVFADQTLDILRDLTQQKVGAQFTKDELTLVIQHLVDLKLIPSLSTEAISRLLDLVLNHLLVDPLRRIDGYRPRALNTEAVDLLRRELHMWLETSQWIQNTTRGWSPEGGYGSADFVALLQSESKNASYSRALRSGLEEMLRAAQSPVPMTFDVLGHLNISNRRDHTYTAKSIRQLNLSRSLSRVLIRSLITDKARLTSYRGLTLKEIEDGFATARPFLVELELVDAKNTTFASSRFREANIFVPRSDGNSLASFTEITDLISMIWSGLSLNSLLREELVRVCFPGRDPETNPVKNTERVSLSCARRAYKPAMARILTATPEYGRFAGRISNDEWTSYIDNLFKAAGYIPNGSNRALLEELALTPHVLQYTEMIYARFDLNRDAILSSQEAVRAFPAFKGILKDLAKPQLADGSLKEENLLDLFTYILRYGRPPTTWQEKLQFVLNWRNQPEKWDVAADRSMLAGILGYIADEVNKAVKNNKPHTYGIDFNLEPGQGRP